MTRKRSTFKWFEWAFIITKVELISILPLFPQSKLIGQLMYKKRLLQELSIGVWVDFGQILASKWVPGNLGLTVLYMRPLRTPLSCVWQYFGQFWEKKSKLIVFYKPENLTHMPIKILFPALTSFLSYHLTVKSTRALPRQEHNYGIRRK
jgi:hypothetical protein